MNYFLSFLFVFVQVTPEPLAPRHPLSPADRPVSCGHRRNIHGRCSGGRAAACAAATALQQIIEGGADVDAATGAVATHGMSTYHFSLLDFLRVFSYVPRFYVLYM